MTLRSFARQASSDLQLDRFSILTELRGWGLGLCFRNLKPLEATKLLAFNMYARRTAEN